MSVCCLWRGETADGRVVTSVRLIIDAKLGKQKRVRFIFSFFTTNSSFKSHPPDRKHPDWTIVQIEISECLIQHSTDAFSLELV